MDLVGVMDKACNMGDDMKQDGAEIDGQPTILAV